MHLRDLESLENYLCEGLEGSIKKWRLLKRILQETETGKKMGAWFRAARVPCGLCIECGSFTGEYCDECVLYKHNGLSCVEWDTFLRVLKLAKTSAEKDNLAEVKDEMLVLCDEIIGILEHLKNKQKCDCCGKESENDKDFFLNVSLYGVEPNSICRKNRKRLTKENILCKECYAKLISTLNNLYEGKKVWV